MDKYSEAVKEAQEKLELAEKKATDVSAEQHWGGESSRIPGERWRGHAWKPLSCLPAQAEGD